MWIPQPLIELLTINRETTTALRTEIEVLRAKNELVERELAVSKINSDWMRMRVNQLEVERVRLIEKAYPGLVLPAPELSKVNRLKESFDMQALFGDAEEFDKLTNIG